MFTSLKARLATAGKILKRAKNPLILTGAGISVASGIPSFRGPGGLWKNRELIKYAFGGYADSNPDEVFAVFEAVRARLDLAQPNPTHLSIERYLQWVKTQGGAPRLFTQNIDGLHSKAGSDAIELHGCILRRRCTRCDYQTREQLTLTVCPACHGRLRHDVVLFDEELPYHDLLTQALADCDSILLIGTSGTVTNTASMAKYAAQHSIPVIEVNPALFPATFRWATVTIRQPAELAVPQLFAHCA